MDIFAEQEQPRDEFLAAGNRLDVWSTRPVLGQSPAKRRVSGGEQPLGGFESI